VLACGRCPPLWATCAEFPGDQKLPSSMSLEMSRRHFPLRATYVSVGVAM